jgi:hypothetical protein
MYSKHIDHLYESITYAPHTFADTNISTKYIVVNNANLLFLKKEKDLKFYLNVETEENLKIFNFTHYILSFILIFFLNIFRIILKY